MWPARATVGRQSSRCVCHSGGFFMLQSRRGFLIGAGAVLTTAFVKDARSFIHRTSQPLLASPSQVVQTLYWHEIPDEGYQLTLGPWSFAPPPPTWRTFFVSRGIPHRTNSEIEKVCSSHLIEPGDFDRPMSARFWEDWFDIEGGPLARAYHLLQKIDLGPEHGGGPGPHLEFNIGSIQATTRTMSTRRTCCRFS